MMAKETEKRELTKEEKTMMAEWIDKIPDDVLGIMFKYSFNKGYESAYKECKIAIDKARQNEHEIGYLEGYKMCLTRVYDLHSKEKKLKDEFIRKVAEEIGMNESIFAEDKTKGMN